MSDYTVQTNGITLHYLDHAAAVPDAPTLVLSHGLSANAHSFDGLIAAGLNRRLRVIALDLRGRGLSDKPATGYDMADHAADVLGLLDALGLERVILGGHSFGGLLSLYLAVTAPERTQKLIMIDAAAQMHPNVLELIKPSLDRLGRSVPSWEAYREQIRRVPFLHGQWDASIEAFYRADVRSNADGSVQAHASPDHIRQAVEGLLKIEWQSYPPQVRQPALLLHATGPFGVPGTPPVVEAAGALETVALLPNGRYVELPGNHLTMVFAPHAATAVAAIEAFVFES